MPCRHKGNKQALLSAASTIPHQWLHNNHPSAASLKKKRKKEKWSASQRRLYENHVHFRCFNRHKHSFFPPFAVTYCSAKNSSLYFKVLALNGASSRWTISQTLNIWEQMTFRCSCFVWKTAPLAERFVRQVRNSWACQQREHPSAVGVRDDKCPSGVAVWKSSVPQ